MFKFTSYTNILFYGLLACCFVACNANKHAPETYFSQSELDTLMVDVVTYIYKRPRGVSREDRFNPDHRSKYALVINEFEFINLHFNKADSTYMFYLKRPVKSPDGKVRGVGGKFKVNESLRITYFKEIFNTPMITEEEVRTKGKYLWDDLMYFNNVDRYYLNKDFVEFPDEGCKYDTINYEWTYSF